MQILDSKKFDWGNSTDWYKSYIGDEIFNKRIYEKYFQVEKDDIVLDVGASTGIFTYSVLPRQPKHVICIEPSFDQFITLNKNTIHGNVTCINKAISQEFGTSDAIEAYNDEKSVHYTIPFKKIIENYNLTKIDFLKTDCEGGEYDMFTMENLVWVKQNVKKIVGEFHLGMIRGINYTEKFRIFRDVYLRVFENYKVYSLDNIDIKWELFTDKFLNHYKQVLIYIDNR